jgi:hypothetical protein
MEERERGKSHREWLPESQATHEIGEREVGMFRKLLNTGKEICPLLF